MTLFPDLSFFLFIPVYFLATLLAFFIPGDILLRKVSLSLPARLAIALTLGITLWAIQGLIVGYLHLRALSYVYLLVTTAIWIIPFITSRKKIKLRLFLPHVDKISLFIIVVGGLLQLSAIWLIGFRQSEGILFCCRSIPDSIYHIALTSELVTSFPPMEPGSAGIVVKNYHYLANLVLADLIRVFNLPLIPTVYQYSSVFLIFFFAVSAAAITQLAKLSKQFQRWFLFFLFFAGDVLYVLIFLRSRVLNLEYTIIDDASKLLTGPPRSFSIALFFGLVALILLWQKEKKLWLSIFVGLVTGILLEFKVYTGIVALGGLGGLTLVRLAKKDFTFTLSFAIALLTTLATYLPVNEGAGGLIFSGTWRFENFMAQPIFNFQTLELSRLTFLAANNYLRVSIIEIGYGITYLITMLGVTLLALGQTKSSLKKLPTELTAFLGATLLASLVLGLFFVQATGGANTIQFIIQYLTLCALLLALTVETNLKRLPKYLGIMAAILIVVFASTRTIHEGLGNIIDFEKREKFFVSNQQIESSEFLRDQVPASSLVMLGDSSAFAASSMYLSFVSAQPLYLAGTSDHGVAGLEKRITLNKKLLETTDCGEAKRLLSESGATILYRVNNKPLLCETQLPLTPLFENEAQTIFRVGQN